MASSFSRKAAQAHHIKAGLQNDRSRLGTSSAMHACKRAVNGLLTPFRKSCILPASKVETEYKNMYL
jgi:formylmethanofuran:tetrahydromethanopterin formyltransferase